MPELNLGTSMLGRFHQIISIETKQKSEGTEGPRRTNEGRKDKRRNQNVIKTKLQFISANKLTRIEFYRLLTL